MVRDELQFNLNFVMQFFRKERGNEGHNGGSRVVFWMDFEKPPNLGDIDRTNCVWIQEESMFLEERQQKWGVFDRVKAKGGLEGGVDSAKALGECWGGETIMELLNVMWKRSSRGQRGGSSVSV